LTNRAPSARRSWDRYSDCPRKLRLDMKKYRK
jgi:hypothetical protein